jgi:predicted RNase H-like nuclease
VDLIQANLIKPGREELLSPNRAAIFVGFDSAWADRKRAPGAICSVVYDGDRFTNFRSPERVGFEKALTYINSVQHGDLPTIVALDQPTIVPNPEGMRPVEKAVASLISWLGGGVQPANQGKLAMFGPQAPIWTFRDKLQAQENPEAARNATGGLHLMEVFPALALASLQQEFFGRLKAPHYNPRQRKTFKIEDWRAVIAAARKEAMRLHFDCKCLSEWLDGLAGMEKPNKTSQDCLDAVLCLLIAIRWRLGVRADSVLVGDLQTGYMVAPVCAEVMDRLAASAKCMGVRVDTSG